MHAEWQSEAVDGCHPGAYVATERSKEILDDGRSSSCCSAAPRRTQPVNVLPRDANAAPQETVITSFGAWQFIGMGNVPLITRKVGGVADDKRRAFLNDIAPLRAGAVLPLNFYARDMGRLWGEGLPPNFPTGFRPDQTTASLAGRPDLVAALVVLLRVGLLVVDGVQVDAVTRSNQHVSSPRLSLHS